ncbi:LysE family translocator [Defluviicoccus vanus]|uniref:LysE family translocator n=1 Tax=Defluviicoccus vanus TaxID=111831 RepID=UPI001CBA64A2|nr:LysE family translocator [Defluviicoccus vanus]
MSLPVDAPLLARFALAALAIVLSPGPDTMLIVRHALGSGRSAGFAAVAGVQLGLLVHTTLAAAGISALITASPALFHSVAILGAIYLGWLGAKAVLTGGTMVLAVAGPVRRSLALRQAFFTNLLNPKVLLLFFALYPNFLVAGGASLALQITLLSAVLIAINSAWQLGLAWFADRARQLFVNPRLMRGIDVGVGLVLLGFAALLLVEHGR